jgi:hypothetical protein
MTVNVKILICSLGLLMFTACEKEKDFPDEPILTVREFTKVNSNYALWRLGFTDGDGDIGVRTDSDKDNFIVTIFRIDTGVPTELNATNYRIPVVDNIRTSNGIEGEFRFDIDNLDLFRIENIDSVVYEAYVIDRKGNESNVVRTPEFSVN